jgi:hypothetical protein
MPAVRRNTRDTDQPLYWLVILDQSVESGDLQTAARAQRELERLGVHVQYGRQSKHYSGGAEHAQR